MASDNGDWSLREAANAALSLARKDKDPLEEVISAYRTVGQALEDYYNSRSELSTTSQRCQTAFDNVEDILSRAAGDTHPAYRHLGKARLKSHESHTDAQRDLDSKAERISADFLKAELMAADYVIAESYGHDTLQGMPDEEKLQMLPDELDKNSSNFVRLYHIRQRILDKMPKIPGYSTRMTMEES